MRKSGLFLLKGIFLYSFLVTSGFASEMVYTPVNPDFGGSPFNGSYLLGEASANNHYTAPTQNTSDASLNSLVTSSVLSSVSTRISNAILNSTNGQSGSFNSGADTISYRNLNGTVTMTVLDNSTGQTTVVTFPSGI